MTPNLELGIQTLTAVNQTYVCSNPNCTESSHIIKNGCPNETAEIVEARKFDAVQSSLISYIKENPSLITP